MQDGHEFVKMAEFERAEWKISHKSHHPDRSSSALSSYAVEGTPHFVYAVALAFFNTATNPGCPILAAVLSPLGWETKEARLGDFPAKNLVKPPKNASH